MVTGAAACLVPYFSSLLEYYQYGTDGDQSQIYMDWSLAGPGCGGCGSDYVGGQICGLLQVLQLLAQGDQAKRAIIATGSDYPIFLCCL